MSLKIFFFFSVILFFPVLLFSQQYNFRIFSVEKGLPKSSIYSIIQDKRGYLWLGTDGGGVCRFDGKHFVSFTKRNGLVGNVVRTMMEDKKGNLWFGTDDGISIYNGYKFFTINKAKGLPASPVMKIFEDSQNNIWVGTAGGGLCKLKFVSKDSVSIKTYTKEQDKLQTNFVFDICQDKSKRLWLALYGGINILTFENDNIKNIIKLDQVYGDIPSNFILTIEKDFKGNLWFGSQDAGAFKIITAGKDSGKVVPYGIAKGLNDVTVWDIMCDSRGNLWFATDKGGINKLTDYGFIHITQQNGLSGNQVYKLFEDDENNIWVGTFGSGLCQFLGENFIHYTEKDGLPNKDVLSIVQDKTGKYWMATDGGGLVQASYVNNKPVFKTFTTRNGLIDNFINALALGKDGALWIATQKGVSRYDPSATLRTGGKTFRNFSGKDSKILNNQVKSIYVDSKGIVWCGTNDGMVRYDGTKFFPIHEEDDKFAQFNYILTILEDKRGEVWYGTFGGLLRNTHQRFIFYDEAEGLQNKQINCLEEDRYGNIWIGTFGSGVFKFDIKSKDKKPIKFVMNDSILGSNNISSLFFENENSLLVGTDKGFDRVIMDNAQKIVKVLNFNESDGFTGVENHTNSICRDNKNNLWFGTIKGLTKYSPAFDNINLKPPRTHLTTINLFFSNIDWLKKTDSIIPWFNLPGSLKLGYSDNHITFKFTGISFFNPEKINYKYKLDGLDMDWTPARTESEAVYPGLAPGDYTFKLIAQNKFGTWNSAPVKFSFTLKPPFWRTTLFYISTAVFIILCFYLFLVIRVRKLKRDKRILEQKVRERTAEIEKQKQEILEKNEELHQQNEEILTQRNEIENQKHIVEEKNLEITDSIRYARRIQSAVLPSEEYVGHVLTDYFILFKPKDIVSGDFYWLFRKNNLLLLTAADCTGHGVPGAFMSMLGLSFLTEIVNRPDITTTNQVLDELRINIIRSLQQKGVTGEQKDGMDISFCCLNLETNTLQYSGANNPLYLLSKNEDPQSDGKPVLVEIKPDKMPVAIHDHMPPFARQEISLKKGDTFYLLSDGYEDQFGGPKGKKFKSSQFKQLLLEMYHLPMKEQGEFLDMTIEKWKTGFDAFYEQTDDVTVIGVRV
ncbi:MAG: SpoIIE family protein phosphatase [Bacteroidia bacterium]|nr:SpoIIE family protein phosphatase [Bacteroidia bacterium]